MRHITLFVSSDLMSISFAFRYRGALDYLDVRGIIDVANASEFRTVLLDAVEDCTPHLAVDIRGIHFADPSGMGVLIGALRNARLENKRADVVCTDQRILEIFVLTSLDQTFVIYESIETAMAANLELRNYSPIEPTVVEAAGASCLQN